MFTGRVVEPGAPLFLAEDTDGAIALEEEERDTCQSCGMPKVWCRDSGNQFAVFEVREEQCHATYALAAHRAQVSEGRDETARQAVQMWTRFAEGKEPDFAAGLDLPEDATE